MDPTDVMVPVAEGVHLHVRHWAADPATGPPFVLVHGLSSNARLWDGVAPHLAAAGQPVHAVDLRSHGDSDRPPAGYDTATAAEDLAALIGALGLPPVIAAGQSWGGNVVIMLAATHPAVVRAVALVDGGWIDLPSEFNSWAACETILRPSDIDGVSERALRGYIRREHPDWGDWAIDATVANFRPTDSGLERRLPIEQHMQIVRSMWDDPPARHYPDVEVPALLVPAVSKDRARAATRGQLFRKATAALPRATVKEYIGADHDLHAQHPDELARDLLDLAAGLDPT
jgi:pimeloyl-ACP methyl ester carboxylesterase